MAREEHEIAVGLDIGTTKIVAMVGVIMSTEKWKFWVLVSPKASGYIVV